MAENIVLFYAPYFYTCAGCNRQHNKYMGEMYLVRRFGFKGQSGTIHKFCCSEKCYYFAWFKYINDIHPGFRNNPQLHEPIEYVEF